MSLIKTTRKRWKIWARNLPRLRWLEHNARVSYSQEGEDLVLMRIFEKQVSGIYVDVGAHHPFRFSNTCLLHQHGWRGINVDALPGSMKSFRTARPRDICLESAVGTDTSKLTYYMFAEPALNTFDCILAGEREALGWVRRGQLEMPITPLCSILDRELPRLGATAIDVLNIDVEGLDLQVLRSNDWSRFRPRVLIIEAIQNDLEALISSEVHQYCKGLGYRMFSKLVHSVIYVDLQRAGSHSDGTFE